MVILTLVVTPIFFVNTVNDAAALLFARGADFLTVFDQAQRDAFVMLFLNLHDQLDLANEMLGACGSFRSGCSFTGHVSCPAS